MNDFLRFVHKLIFAILRVKVSKFINLLDVAV